MKFFYKIDFIFEKSVKTFLNKKKDTGLVYHVIRAGGFFPYITFYKFYVTKKQSKFFLNKLSISGGFEDTFQDLWFNKIPSKGGVGI